MIEMQTCQNMQAGVTCCHGKILIDGLQGEMNAELTALCSPTHSDKDRRRNGPGVSDTITCSLPNVNPNYMHMYSVFMHISSAAHTCLLSSGPYCKTTYYTGIHLSVSGCKGSAYNSRHPACVPQSCTSESCLFISYT